MAIISGLYSDLQKHVRDELNSRKGLYSKYDRAETHRWSVQKLAYVKIISKGKDNSGEAVTLTPPPQGGFAKQYTGSLLKPNGILRGVDITTGGKAGSLQRCDVKFTVFTLDQLEYYEEHFLFPGRFITIEYGWAGFTSDANKGTFTGLTYNFNWSINSDGAFECTFQAVGPGYFSLGTNPAGTGTLGSSKKNASLEIDVIGLYETLNVMAKSLFEGEKATDIIKTKDNYDFYLAQVDYQDVVNFTSEQTPAGSTTPVYYITFGSLLAYINDYLLYTKNNSVQLNTNSIPLTKIYAEECFGYWDKNIRSANYMEILFPGINADYGNPDSFDLYNGAGKTNTDVIKKYRDKFKGTKSPKSFITGTMEFKDSSNKDRALIKNVLISLDLIREILSESESEKSDKDIKKTYKKTLHDLLIALMKSIEINSGGAYKLDLYFESSADLPVINVICTNYVVQQNFEPYTFELNRVDNIIRNFSISSQLPNDLAAAMYIGSRANATAHNQSIISLFETDNIKREEAEKMRKQAYEEAFDTYKANCTLLLSYGPLTKEKVDSMRNSMSEYIRNYPKEKWNNSPEYPITLSITMDGISGLRYGNIFSFKTLPKRYIDDIVFMITEINHSFDGFDWTTEIKAQCRFKPGK